MKDVQEIIDELTTNSISNQDLEQYLESPSMLIKVNAIIAVLRNKIIEKNIIYKLNLISQNIQHEPKVLGEWTTGHCAMAVLYLLNTKDTLDIYKNNIKKLDNYDKEGIKKLMNEILYMLN